MIAEKRQKAESDVQDDYAAKLQKYMDKGAEGAQPSQDNKAQQHEVDALVLDLLKQVMTESDGSTSRAEPAKDESPHSSVGTQKPKANIPKPAPKKSSPVAATSAKHKRKTLFIVIACLSALAAAGIPVYIFTGSSNQASKPALSLPAAPAAPAADFKSLAAGQTAAVPIVKVVPRYPELGIRGDISGSVVLLLSIESDGMVVQSTPISGNPLFFNAAIETANQWRFKPATANGKNVASRTRITLHFRPQR